MNAFLTNLTAALTIKDREGNEKDSWGGKKKERRCGSVKRFQGRSPFLYSRLMPGAHRGEVKEMVLALSSEDTKTCDRG